MLSSAESTVCDGKPAPRDPKIAVPDELRLTQTRHNERVRIGGRRIKPGWIILGALALWLVVTGLLRRPPPIPVACAGEAPPSFSAPRALPRSLEGLRVALNPGHGLTMTDDGDWGFQRPRADGWRVFLLEDDSNLRLARIVRDRLEASGAEVFSTRELEAGGVGASGQPAWREASVHHLERLKLPHGLWNSRGDDLRGDCRSGRDLRARAYYANHVGADVLLSLHSNAGSPWSRGTQVISSARPYLRATPPSTVSRSACLGKAFLSSLPDAIRQARPDLRWPNAEIISSDRYGENGFALMPSVILEIGFHTNAVDGRALRQDSFRQVVAKGVLDGLKTFLENPDC